MPPDGRPFEGMTVRLYEPRAGFGSSGGNSDTSTAALIAERSVVPSLMACAHRLPTEISLGYVVAAPFRSGYKQCLWRSRSVR
jgi:hypothetical protein